MLLLVIIVGATVANLIALKIAASQVQSQINSTSTGGILSALFGSKSP